MVLVAKDNNIQIDKLELGPFGTNAYVIVCPASGDSVLIDAPAEANKILERLKGTNPQYILMTHSHMDHVGALSELGPRLRVPVAAHPSDARKLPIPPQVMLNDGDTVSFGNIELRVLHTPGHTASSLCFLTGQYLIAGDTIFPGGPGKTGSPADFQQIVDSITKKVLVLADDTQIHPGHGDSTTVGKAKEEYAAFASRPHPPELCGDVLWLSS